MCVILILAAENWRQQTSNLQGFPVLTQRAPEKQLKKRFEKIKKVVDKLP